MKISQEMKYEIWVRKKTDPLEKAIEIIILSVDPEKIILFGSRARDDHNKESDYDICVIKKGVSHRRKLAQQIYKFLYGMGVPVDIIVETPEKFEELKGNPFMIYKEISTSGKVVYEKWVTCQDMVETGKKQFADRESRESFRGYFIWRHSSVRLFP